MKLYLNCFNNNYYLCVFISDLLGTGNINLGLWLTPYCKNNLLISVFFSLINPSQSINQEIIEYINFIKKSISFLSVNTNRFKHLSTCIISVDDKI